MNNLTIGCQLVCHYGEYKTLRDQWVKAEELGADRLFASDHLHAIPIDPALLTGPNDGSHNTTVPMNVFEGTTIQAAMAATTSRAQIGCSVNCNAYRNPNMLAYISSTIDHISDGRFFLGIGTGFAKADFDAYGYEYGTQSSRSLALDRDIPVILDRFTKLMPPPKHKIPLMVASMGEKIGLRTVAKYADIWHVYGPFELMMAKTEVLKQHCKEVGRDFNEIEICTNWWPDLMKGSDDTLENYVKMGAGHIMVVTQGPNWDLGLFKELAAWHKSLG